MLHKKTMMISHISVYDDNIVMTSAIYMRLLEYQNIVQIE